jgi:hypothetical protein
VPDDEEEEGEEEDSGYEENADEKDEEEDSSEDEQEEDEPARPSSKPVHAAPACPERAEGPAPRRQPGAKPAIVADLDGNAIARHLLEVLDFGPPPAK